MKFSLGYNDEKFEIKIVGSDCIDDICILQEAVLKGLENRQNLVEVEKNLILSYLKDENNVCIGVFERKTKKLVAYSDFLTQEYSSNGYYKSKALKGYKKSESMYFRAVYTHPKYRGRGFMQKVLKHFINIAKQKNVKFIVSTVAPTNKASLHNFYKMGFKVADEYSFEYTGIVYNRNVMYLII